jgi:hypothetical protein
MIDLQKKYGKNYTATEDSQRKEIFLATNALITRHNSQKNETYTLELNNFSDMVKSSFFFLNYLD